MSYRIKEFREKLGLTQDELARKSGVSRMTIVALENNKAKVTTTKTLLAISKALGVTVDEIFFPKDV